MSIECPYLNGNSKIQCHQTRALTAAKVHAGEVFTPSELRELLCKAHGDEGRTNDCPAFNSLGTHGIKSQYAKPVAYRVPL